MISTPAPADGQVLHELVRTIRAAGLQAGDRLPSIRELSARLGVGANAIRDALLHAQALGLVKIRPRSGAFVQTLNYAPQVDHLAGGLESSLVRVDQNLFHLLEARETLECQTAGLAARRRRLEDLLPVRAALEAMIAAQQCGDSREHVAADMRFHLAIAEIAGNRVLTMMLEALLNLLRPYLLDLGWNPQRLHKTEASHAAIYQALVAGDAEQARQAIAQHLGMAYESLLALVQTAPA